MWLPICGDAPSEDGETLYYEDLSFEGRRNPGCVGMVPNAENGASRDLSMISLDTAYHRKLPGLTIRLSWLRIIASRVGSRCELAAGGCVWLLVGAPQGSFMVSCRVAVAVTDSNSFDVLSLWTAGMAGNGD